MDWILDVLYVWMFSLACCWSLAPIVKVENVQKVRLMHCSSDSLLYFSLIDSSA